MFSMENHCSIRGNLYNLSNIHPYPEAIDPKTNLSGFLVLQRN
mgnify:CR=1 FL=1